MPFNERRRRSAAAGYCSVSRLGRLIAVATIAVATLLGLIVPQRPVLDWWPIDRRDPNVHYVEVVCAADQAGVVQLLYDVGGDFNQRDTIALPISATARTFTYRFPLPDAPLRALRVDPLPQGGTLLVAQFRVVRRDGVELLRLSPNDISTRHAIESIGAFPEGWTVTSQLRAERPSLVFALKSPLEPAEAKARSILRWARSFIYVATLISLPLFVCAGALRVREYGGILLVIALAGGAVASRGLLHGALSYPRALPIPPDTGFLLEIELTSTGSSPTQLYWDIGAGISGSDSHRAQLVSHSGMQWVRFPLPPQAIRSLRYDPRDNDGSVTIRNIRVLDGNGRTRAVLPLESLTAIREVRSLRLTEGRLAIETTPGATDPILEFTPAAVNHINQVTAPARF